MFRNFFVAIASALIASVLPGATPPSVVGVERVTGVVLEDGAGDVWGSVGDEPGQVDHVTFPPADVKRVLVRHATYAVRIRMQFVDLRRVGRQEFAAGIWTSPDTRPYLAGVISKPGNRRGFHFFAQGGGSGSCPGVTHRIDYSRNVVQMRIPRSCLGRPAWVTVQLDNSLETVAPCPERQYMDNPHNHEGFPSLAERTRRLYRE